MRIHQCPVIDARAARFLVLNDELTELLPIPIVDKDPRAIPPAIREMVTQRPLEDSCRSWHAQNLAQSTKRVNIRITCCLVNCYKGCPLCPPWMPDVRVLAPKRLHERIVEKLQAGLKIQDPNHTSC